MYYKAWLLLVEQQNPRREFGFKEVFIEFKREPNELLE